MIRQEKCLVLDVDGTICPVKGADESYDDLLPYPAMVKRIREFKSRGFYIILYTSRNMRTHAGNLGRINAETAKVLLNWLDRHEIPYDEIHYGKPWAGHGGFYVDDRSVRPREFLEMNHEEILELLDRG
jgi:capsule biosynthesis phosphatase